MLRLHMPMHDLAEQVQTDGLPAAVYIFRYCPCGSKSALRQRLTAARTRGQYRQTAAAALPACGHTTGGRLQACSGHDDQVARGPCTDRQHRH